MNMKRFLSTLVLMAVAMTMMAVPAKKGLTKTIQLANGTEVKATLVGDEHGHYWKGEDGLAYQETDANYYQTVSTEKIAAKAKARRANLKKHNRAMRRVSMGEQTHYTGQKKGIVILMQFSNKSFQSGNNKAKYNDIMNKENYQSGNFRGSVADYFKAQSGGIFELTFDVVGPYTAKKQQNYYGKNDSGGNDMYAEELIVEALQAADNEVNYKDYDWDGDGEVDQVFVLYAGTGEADGGAESTIWPHMYNLSASGRELTLDGVKLDTYACSNEVTTSNTIEGIGCFCHEYSHCMGFPDFYDTSYSGWFGMGDWDLMCSGSYNGNTFCPAGYSAYEKWMSGWLEPIELTDDVQVDNLKAISEGGAGYILYNSGHKDEYYMIENRQQTKWDEELPGAGLMITHVDFDKTIWEENNPNTKVTEQDVQEWAAEGYTIHANDHQRFTLIRANNQTSENSYASDLYPYNSKNSLTANTTPKASLYNTNAAGKKTMEKGITAIKKNNDKTMSFTYGNPSGQGGGGDDPQPSGNGAYEKVTSASQIAVGNEYVLFNADYSLANGPFDFKYLTSVEVEVDGNTISGDGLAPMTLGGAANGYSLKIGDQYVTSTAAKALSLTDTESKIWTITSTDDGYVVDGGSTLGKIQFNYNSGNNPRFMNYTSGQKPAVLYLKKTTTGIENVKVAAVNNDNRIYTLDGRYVGNDYSTLSRGLYIINGKKIVK